ncbi:M1 family metallopeptidase [Streptomyces sp. NPDC006459]|uniref:M1 family metallopeptidase n=1 Tax=Streptomyces sp. NPDC006459 TaxID=3154303 RepID=UPI0033A80B7E
MYLKKRHTVAALVGGAILSSATFSAWAGMTPPDAREGEMLSAPKDAGYDAREYSVGLEYTPGTTKMRGDVTMTAVASKPLETIQLDYAAGAVSAVSVDGNPARSRVNGQKLKITPDNAIPEGKKFTVRVQYTTNRSAKIKKDGEDRTAWRESKTGFALYAQPNFARMVFPSHDHPSDKASFTIKVTVPHGYTGIASGQLTSQIKRAGEETFTYRLAEPAATQTIQIAAGKYTKRTADGPHGIQLNYFEPVGTPNPNMRRELDRTTDEINWLEQRFGAYPSQSYGILAFEGDYEGALETQTLSTINASHLSANKGPSPALLTVHELTHQWFGNHVAVSGWKDIWMSEGHATLYEYAYPTDRGLLNDPDTGKKLDMNLTQVMREFYKGDQEVRNNYGPPAAPISDAAIFGSSAYVGGALALYALQEEVGESTFTKIEKEFLRTYGGKNASTDDYIHTASEVSGRDLTSFLKKWLEGTKTPPMPNHPDW